MHASDQGKLRCTSGSRRPPLGKAWIPFRPSDALRPLLDRGNVVFTEALLGPCSFSKNPAVASPSDKFACCVAVAKLLQHLAQQLRCADMHTVQGCIGNHDMYERASPHATNALTQ